MVVFHSQAGFRARPSPAHALFLLLAASCLLPVASAAVAVDASAADVARAVEVEAGSVGDAAWLARPSGDATAVASTPLGDFPIHGDNYAILSTGDASAADDADATHKANTDLGGGALRGESDRDVTVLRLSFDACADGELRFDYRFLTEEAPKWTGQSFDDAFVAELDASTWTTTKDATVAPDAFAMATVHTADLGPAAPGTPYDRATLVQTASVAVTAGSHDLYLSVFDFGRPTFDSAVLVDNLQVPACEPPCDEPCEEPCGANVDYDAGTAPLAPPERAWAEVTLDACRPVPCSTGEPVSARTDADGGDARVSAWPEGTLGGYVSASAPLLGVGYGLDLATDADDCVA